MAGRSWGHSQGGESIFARVRTQFEIVAGIIFALGSRSQLDFLFGLEPRSIPVVQDSLTKGLKERIQIRLTQSVQGEKATVRVEGLSNDFGKGQAF